MSLVICALVGLAATGSSIESAQEPTRFSGPASEIETHFKTISVGLIGDPTFSVGGAPARVVWKDQGLTLAAGSIHGALGTSGGEYFLKESRLSGSARLDFSQARQFEFFAERARQGGGPAPARPQDWLEFDLTSETMSYGGDPEEGAVTLPVAFNFKALTHGVEEVRRENRTLSRSYEDTIELSGSGGTIGVRARPASGSNPFRKGHVVGPVTFRYARNSRVADEQEPQIDVRGSADRLEFDFVSERTVTLLGNVRIRGVQGSTTGSTSGDRAVFMFGTRNELKQVIVDGSPTESNLRPGRATGGGR